MVTAEPKLQLKPYCAEHREAWDKLVRRSPRGTILHSRRYLDYHGDRFTDLSAIFHKEGRFHAVFPLAEAPNDARTAISHPGISFGGIVGRSSRPLEYCEMLAIAAERLLGLGYSKLELRAVPGSVIRQPYDALLPTLLSNGRVVRVDLWSIVNLGFDAALDVQIGSMISRGKQRGLSISELTVPDELSIVYGIIDAKITDRYQRHPTHSFQEFVDLHQRLGKLSRPFLVRETQGEPVAAVWCIDYGTGVIHTQYMGGSTLGFSLKAVEFAVANIHEIATQEGYRVLSMGRSTLDDGWSFNPGLVFFKSNFGAGLESQLHIEVDLRKLVHADY